MADRVIAHFDDRRHAERAMDELRLAGFRDDQLSLGGAQDHSFLDALLPRSNREEERPTVTVTGSRLLEAATLLQRLGGHDEEKAPDADDGTGSGQLIELLEEEPYPELVPVQVGEVRVRKVVEEETRVIEVRVRREELVVERLPVSALHRSSAAAAELGDVDEDSAAPGAAGGQLVVRRGDAAEPVRELTDGQRLPTTLGADEEVIRIPLLEEQVVVTMRPVVREEVLIRKRRVSEPQVHTVNVQREELQVEHTGDAQVEHEHAGGTIQARG